MRTPTPRCTHTPPHPPTPQIFWLLFIIELPENVLLFTWLAIYFACHFVLPIFMFSVLGEKRNAVWENLTIRNKIILSFVPFHISSLLLTVLDLSCLLDGRSFLWTASKALSSDWTSLKSLAEVATDCSEAMCCFIQLVQCIPFSVCWGHWNHPRSTCSPDNCVIISHTA